MGEIPGRLMLVITVTNWLWIPFVVWGDLAMPRLTEDGAGAAWHRAEQET